jgi:hypothetical protein
MVLAASFQSAGLDQVLVPVVVRKMTVAAACAWIGKRESAAAIAIKQMMNCCVRSSLIEFVMSGDCMKNGTWPFSRLYQKGAWV